MNCLRSQAYALNGWHQFPFDLTVCKKVYGVNGKAERKRLARARETLAPSESSASEQGNSSLLTRIRCLRCFGSTSSFTLLRSGWRSSEVPPLLSMNALSPSHFE